MPQPGTELAAHAQALTGNQTSNLLLCRAMPNQLSHTDHGLSLFLYNLSRYFFKGEERKRRREGGRGDKNQEKTGEGGRGAERAVRTEVID